jgi:hypothetical protein
LFRWPPTGTACAQHRSIASIKPDVAAHWTKMPLAEEIAGFPCGKRPGPGPTLKVL